MVNRHLKKALLELEVWIREISPTLVLRFAILTRYAIDPDLKLIPYLCNKELAAVDVGAHVGLYTHYILKNTSFVYAFEPNPHLAKALRRNFPTRVQVEEVALSDKSGVAQMRMPKACPGRATIEEENTLKLKSARPIDSQAIAVKRLDDYPLKKIGFLKLDVEGHEFAVLRGAKAVIQRDRPIIFTELVEDHRPDIIGDVTNFLRDLGYRGYYQRNGILHEIESFDSSVYQAAENLHDFGRVGEYIMNFLFFPNEMKDKVCQITRNL